MTDHFDRLETRTPAARESALFRDLRHVLTLSRSRAPALRAQLKGIDPAKLQSRADLALVPLRRFKDLLALQDDSPPFGGLAGARLGSLCQAFAAPGEPAVMAGPAKDWWGMGRALFAAGLRKGTLVLNCFAYDLSPLGHMIETGTRAIGCPVIPAGNADLERKVDVIRRFKPRFFCGHASHLKELLDHAATCGVNVACLEAALVLSSVPKGLRQELHLRGIRLHEVLVLPEFGPIAYQSDPDDGLIINESLIVDVVDSDGQLPVAEGMEGEIVLTRINMDYPLLRYATSLRSMQIVRPSRCGRTNMRIATPREMAPAWVQLGEARVHISQIREIAARHPEVGRMRAFTRRPRDLDEFVLKVEHDGAESTLHDRLRETLRLVTCVTGTIELVHPGTLSDEDTMIVDERPLN